MLSIGKKIFERLKINRYFWLFGILTVLNFCLVICSDLRVSAAGYHYNIHIHANYTVSDCIVNGDDVVCKFNVIPDKNLDKQDGYGDPPNQELYIDIEPTNNSYMAKVNEAYLGYWRPWSSKLQDRKTPSYTIRAKKGNLKKEEIKGDITTIKYKTELCFHVDLHWKDTAHNNVTHGISDFCKNIEASETVASAFSGKIESGPITTGWVDDDKNKIRYIEGCSSTDGCEAKFVHSLKRTVGYGSADYEISRTSNYWRESEGIGVEPKVLKNTKELFSDSNSVGVYEETVKLMPGQVVCEEMYFRANSNNDYKIASVCVIALGSAKTSIDESVKNNDVSKFSNFQNTIYARPKDSLTYKTIYNPVLQYAYYLKSKWVRVENSGSVFAPESYAEILGEAFNIHKGQNDGNWHNAFSVIGDNLKLSKNYILDVGNTTNQEFKNDYMVSSRDVGKSLKAIAKTNMNYATKTTPKEIIFSKYGDDALSNIKTGEVTDSAEVLVPYNFVNETKIIETNSKVYAGEEANIEYEISTRLKYNETLEDTYATMVKDAKWNVEICYGSGYTNCVWGKKENSGNLHENDGIYNEIVKNDDSTKTMVDIPDVPAGTKIRVRSAVYPATSGGSDNWQDPEGNHEWAYSKPIELVVAKRPSFQVWGGGVYSARDVNVPEASKLVYGGIHTFGSWAELGLIVDGTVKGIASGAGMGYVLNDNGKLWPDYSPSVPDGNNNVPGNYINGGSEGDFCSRSTLTFANSRCGSKKAGFGGEGSLSFGFNNSIKYSLISDFLPDNEENYILSEGNGLWSYDDIDVFNWFGGYMDNEDFTVGDGIYYYRYRESGRKSLDLVFQSRWESTIGKNKTIVIDSDQDIIISTNMQYSNSGYERVEEIPKIIVYSKGNINIDCGVERIDAVLIAEGGISTCQNENINSSINSRQLKINGATISDTLMLRRTYGAATRYNSIIPAEIINYDTSLYLWADKKTDVTRTGKIMSVYQQELSPRY